MLELAPGGRAAAGPVGGVEALVDDALEFVLARRNLFLNSVGDVSLLQAVLRAAADLGDCASAGPPSEASMASFGARAGLSSIFGL